VSKLKEAREVVDSLKKKAAQQSQILAEKQREADESMAEITSTIQVQYHLYVDRIHALCSHCVRYTLITCTFLFNSLKRNGIRWFHFKLFIAI